MGPKGATGLTGTSARRTCELHQSGNGVRRRGHGLDFAPELVCRGAISRLLQQLEYPITDRLSSYTAVRQREPGATADERLGVLELVGTHRHD